MSRINKVKSPSKVKVVHFMWAINFAATLMEFKLFRFVRKSLFHWNNFCEFENNEISCFRYYWFLFEMTFSRKTYHPLYGDWNGTWQWHLHPQKHSRFFRLVTMIWLLLITEDLRQKKPMKYAGQIVAFFLPPKKLVCNENIKRIFH